MTWRMIRVNSTHPSMFDLIDQNGQVIARQLSQENAFLIRVCIQPYLEGKKDVAWLGLSAIEKLGFDTSHVTDDVLTEMADDMTIGLAKVYDELLEQMCIEYGLDRKEE